jgi:TolB-like protein
LKKFIQELQRRNVIKAAISYVVFSWVLIQAASILYPAIGWGQGAIRNTLIVLIIGFPVWIVFAYVFEWTPTGFKKTEDVAQENSIARSTSKKMNGIIIAGLSLAVLFLLADRIFDFTDSTDATIGDKSIAVLAFTDMSPEKDQEYFSDGISEEILNLLTKIPDLKIVSRTSSFSYKGKELNIKKIGQELQVSHLLDGSIRKSGNTLRITTQLIDVSNGLQLWSETYDRNIEDIFKIQDEIAAKVTQQLKVTLLGAALSSATVNTDAYNLYLQAKQLKIQNSLESDKNALKLIRESIAIDSTYAPSWALLSDCFWYAAFSNMTMSIEEAIKQGKMAANKAIALDPTYAEGYLQLAAFENASWNFKIETELIDKAILLDPNNPEVIKSKSTRALNFGNKNLAIEMVLKTIEIDPLNTLHNYNLSLFYWMDKRYTEAEKSMTKYLLSNPNSAFGNNLMGQIQLSLGHPEKAMEYIDKDADPFWHLYRKSMIVYALGNTKEANDLLKQLIADYDDSSWPNIAHVYAFRGEKDEAFKWLELAFENKDISLLEILNYPEMENLWGDPRWNRFINKLGLPKDHGFHMD